MDPLSRLPVECLHLILHVLAQENKVGSLAALICTNKHIATVTVPFLYNNPYQKAFHNTENQSGVSPHPSGHLLTCMLLAQAAPDCLPRSLSVAISLDTPATTTTGNTTATRPSPLEYLAHIRHLNLERWTVDIDRIWSKDNPPPNILAFAQGETFQRHCQQGRLLPAYRQNFTDTEILRIHYHVMLYQEASWCLALPILEQLQSITIPLSTVGRYFSVIERLRRLESIRLISDDVFGYDVEFARDDEAMAVIHATKNRQHRVTRTVTLFVKEHAALFKGTLKTMIVSDGHFWKYATKVSFGASLFKILRLLPPLSKATALTDDNWRHFVVHHLMTDLQHVESVNIKHNTSDRWLDTVRKHPSFLQRCRTLKQLSMASLGPGSFNWAVQEKLDMEGTRNYHNTIGDFDNGHASATQTAFQQHSLIPLADVNIREGNTPIKDEVDDIAFAFSQTLQSLAVLASDSIRDPTRRIHIGKGWVDLPLLTSLSLDGSRARLVTDSRLLSHCPNVVSVMLGDKTMEYRCQEIVSSQPAHLARLDTLFLTGQSALTFHPATLDSTQSLASLSLTVSERPGIFCFIPPVEELDRSYGVQSNSGATATVIDSGPAIIRPHWSWDWDLPRLHTLRLGAEFAYRFEFRMLQGCPALEALGLDIRMINGQHTRVITEADMFVTAGSDTTEGSGVGTVEPSRRRIVAPSIRAFAMHGCWSIEDNLLEGFLMDMFPNLEDLSERYWKEVTLEGLLKLVRKRSDNKLKKVHMDLAYPSEDEMLRHRFYPFHKVKGRAVLPTKFCFVRAQHHRYVLLHDTEPL